MGRGQGLEDWAGRSGRAVPAARRAGACGSRSTGGCRPRTGRTPLIAGPAAGAGRCAGARARKDRGGVLRPRGKPERGMGPGGRRPRPSHDRVPTPAGAGTRSWPGSTSGCSTATNTGSWRRCPSITGCSCGCPYTTEKARQQKVTYLNVDSQDQSRRQDRERHLGVPGERGQPQLADVSSSCACC